MWQVALYDCLVRFYKLHPPHATLAMVQKVNWLQLCGRDKQIENKKKPKKKKTKQKNCCINKYKQ